MICVYGPTLRDLLRLALLGNFLGLHYKVILKLALLGNFLGLHYKSILGFALSIT
jgi:hypothetical protein